MANKQAGECKNNGVYWSVQRSVLAAATQHRRINPGSPCLLIVLVTTRVTTSKSSQIGRSEAISMFPEKEETTPFDKKNFTYDEAKKTSIGVPRTREWSLSVQTMTYTRWWQQGFTKDRDASNILSRNGAPKVAPALGVSRCFPMKTSSMPWAQRCAR